MAMMERLRSRTRDVARRTWVKYALRGVRENLAHAIPDPWPMELVRDQFRFVETCRIIQEEIGTRFGRLLEIGCGEGHRTEHLAQITERLTGIDVSPIAVERARQRVPAAELIAGDLLAQSWVGDRGRFDLVTACDVFDSTSNTPGLLRAMDRLGGACVATWLAPAARHCELAVMAMPGAEQLRFGQGDTEWVIAWWKGAARRS